MVNQLKLDSFEIVHPELGKRQAQIMWAIHEMSKLNIPTSNLQISKFLGLGVNQVTGRTNELEKLNRIYSIGRQFDGLSRVQVNIWKIKGGLIYDRY